MKKKPVKPKFCCDCDWFVGAVHHMKANIHYPPTCAHPNTVQFSLVTGPYRVTAKEAREKECGNDGKFFWPKEPEKKFSVIEWFRSKFAKADTQKHSAN